MVGTCQPTGTNRGRQESPSSTKLAWAVKLPQSNHKTVRNGGPTRGPPVNWLHMCTGQRCPHDRSFFRARLLIASVTTVFGVDVDVSRCSSSNFWQRQTLLHRRPHSPLGNLPRHLYLAHYHRCLTDPRHSKSPHTASHTHLSLVHDMMT